jgi:Spy/CpxP family protein refolding chaperone
MKSLTALLWLLLATGIATAQHQVPHPAAPQAPSPDPVHRAPTQPYSGYAGRDIKALSPEQVADLRAGRGMSLALPAELNGYPGPKHALDLAEALDLTEAQRRQTKRLVDDMQSQASQLGETVLEAETVLDRIFKEGRATPALVDDATAKVAVAQGRLRASHLKFHLEMANQLSPEQVAKYNRARGYGETASIR